MAVIFEGVCFCGGLDVDSLTNFIYKQTGNLCAVQTLFEHTEIESMVSLLGVEDALNLSERTKT